VTTPASPTPAPAIRQRVEAAVKLTGAARYAADHTPPGTLHAVLVGAPVAAGRLRGVDTAAALALPGVTAVLTAAELPSFGELSPPAAVLTMPFSDDVIRYEGQPVAIVLAESIEAAEAARPAVAVDCTAGEPVLLGHGRHEPAPGAGTFTKGDVDAAFARAPVRVEQTYLQPPRHHNAMETSGTVAQWDGDRLTLWDAVQAAATVVPVVAAATGAAADDVRVVSPHTGGGFGSKGFVWPHELLAAAAARVLGRPVKLHLRRADQFSNVGYQPWMSQTVRLAAESDGTLLAVEHTVVNNSALVETHVEPATEAAKSMYATPAIRTSQHIERVSLNVPTPMRAPVEGPGLWALESAMNELADAVGVDPLDLRLANHADVSPADGRPWSGKGLREAYEEGARRYGWRTRHESARTDGPWRVGHGMATCSMGSFRFPGAARVRLRRDGSVLVESGVHDIGSGVQTALTQIAAEELRIAPERIEVRWGDTDLPRTGPTYGSSTTMGTGSAVAAAARDVDKQLAALGVDVEPAEAMARAGVEEIVGTGTFAVPGGRMNGDGAGTPFAMRTWGAVFVEVGVDPDFGLVRLRRAVGVYSAGRIVNPVTARAQMTGGIIWGWGKATMEESDQEPVHGRWLAKNLSNVAVPVNADIPTDIDVSFVDEYDEHASLIGAKGIGELGATGVDAAVAAAVHDAVGVRVRDLPILPWKILPPG
jgi:xanthine dehydrogenase YagR molybdenum-binding subunit